MMVYNMIYKLFLYKWNRKRAFSMETKIIIADLRTLGIGRQYLG